MNKPEIFETEDGSILFEWIFDQHRFGLWIGEEESSWYLVSTPSPKQIMESGELPPMFAKLLSIHKGEMEI